MSSMTEVQEKFSSCRLSGSESIKLQACEAFRSRDYVEAQRLFERCLKESPKDVGIMSNLAHMHINLENFCKALEHAQNGLKLEPNHIKCLYHCGVASTHLEKYNDAVLQLQKAKQLDPTDGAVKEVLANAEKLLRQSQGHFDPAELFLNPQTGSQNSIANYIGPLKVIKVPGRALSMSSTPQSRPGKGRGLAVTEAVKAGALLAVGKPLGISEGDSCRTSIANAANNSKQALQRIYALYDGTQKSVKTVPDIHIFASNSTGCQARCQAPTNEVDNSKISRIVQCNSFNTGGGRADQIAQTDILVYDKNPQPMANVLYGVLSLVNHSCCPNSTYYILNEAAVLRAGQDLAAGDEVTISYFGDLTDPAALRQWALRKVWGFLCSCPRCAAENKLPLKIHRTIDHFETGIDKAALASGSMCRRLQVAQVLNAELTDFADNLSKTGLPEKHQHWAMFTVLNAHLCLWECCEALGDTNILQQLARTVSAIYTSTQPHSAPHVNSMVRIFTCAQRLSPGTDWAHQAKRDAQAALRLRYGLENDAQEEQGLQIVAKHMKMMYSVPDY